jgi:divalent metal cation (Fe/Co/Zn/Cd) transporter
VNATGISHAQRDAFLAYGLRLEYLTVVWKIFEGLIATTAGLSAGSIALVGFGIDSFIECMSGGILIWRLRAERQAGDRLAVRRLDHVAHQLVAVSLFVLAVYVLADSLWALWEREHPSPSPVGIILTSLSLAVMWWLARAKRRTAAALDSRALAADSFQSLACWWLALITLAGLGLNSAFGMWWADPVAAIGITYLLVREGLGAWRREN